MKDIRLGLNENLPEIPKPSIAICSEGCGWRGSVSKCDEYQGSEGWEYPSYTVHVCPNCGEDIAEYDYEPKEDGK